MNNPRSFPGFCSLVTLCVTTVATLVVFGCSSSDAARQRAERVREQMEKDREAALASEASLRDGGPGEIDPSLHKVNLGLPDDPQGAMLSQEECDAAEQGLEFLDALPIWNFEDRRRTKGGNLQYYWPVASDAYEFPALGSSFRLGGVDGIEYELPANDPRFDPTPTGEVAYPKYMYSYSDETNDFRADWENWHFVERLTRCAGRQDNHVLHLWHTEAFLEWGGGIGRTFRCMNGGQFWRAPTPATESGDTDPNQRQNISADLCGGSLSWRDTACIDWTRPNKDPQAAEICPERDRVHAATGEIPDEDPYMLGMAVDVSEWEGISFWARRSPNSQAGIRLAVGDRYTDADMAFLSHRVDPSVKPYCGHNALCGCMDRKPCTPAKVWDVERYTDDDPLSVGDRKDASQNPARLTTAYFCWDPEVDPPPNPFRLVGAVPPDPMNPPERDFYEKCGPTICDWEDPAFQRLDTRVLGKECLEYEFRGGITQSYCYDPETEEPYPSSEECEDHWMSPVNLSTKWRFYKIPFTELLQQGWAKRSWKLDIDSLTLFRFTWDRGWIDYYIDDVRFYRRKK